MNHLHTTILALAAAFALLLSGCSGDSSSANASADPADVPAEQPAAPFEDEPIDFTWQPMVYSDYQRQGRTPAHEALHLGCIEAMMNGDTTVPCPDQETAWDLLPILQNLFPVITVIVSDISYQDGAVHITYCLSDAEREQAIQDFAQHIENTIEAAVHQNDTPTMAAIALYHYFTRQLTYDYAAMQNDGALHDVTPYRALMTSEGICQSFGPAYAYLCMQLGINAVDAGGLDATAETAHSWTMLELNGHHYFADPTFENSMGGMGLRYFGITAAERELDNYLFEDVNLGFNLMPASEFDVSDETFAPLWDMQSIYELRRTAEGMEILGHSNAKGQYTIPIEEGKTLVVTPAGLPEVEGDVMGPVYAELAATSWQAAGEELAFLADGTVWIDSAAYTGLVQCWNDQNDQLILDAPDGEYEIHLESLEKLILKGPHGDIPAVRTSQEAFDRLEQQMNEILSQEAAG